MLELEVPLRPELLQHQLRPAARSLTLTPPHPTSAPARCRCEGARHQERETHTLCVWRTSVWLSSAQRVQWAARSEEGAREEGQEEEEEEGLAGPLASLVEGACGVGDVCE
eukprot:754344-Rhodomonas_salina.1